MGIDYMYLLFWALGLGVGYYAYSHFLATGKAY
jgi:hypothetical protein